MWNEVYHDNYFSVHDGLGETRHVFLAGNGLPQAWTERPEWLRFRIGELGFGTGLNFLATAALFLDTAHAHQILEFVSIERDPLDNARIRTALAPWRNQLGSCMEMVLAQLPPPLPGRHRLLIHPRIRLTLIYSDILEGLAGMTERMDAWMPDGFAPARNPEMWSEQVFRHMARLSHNRTTLATYTVAGPVRRGLAESGFAVRKMPGHARKKDMLTGHYAAAEAPAREDDATPPANVLVIGGGVSGCAAAYALAREGCRVDICDPSARPGGGLKNFPASLINPKLTRRSGFQRDWHQSAFNLFQTQAGFGLLHEHGERCGSLYLDTTPHRADTHYQAQADMAWPAELLKSVDARGASDLAGLHLPVGGCYSALSGWVAAGEICKFWAADVNWRIGAAENRQALESLRKDYDACIVAAGQGLPALCGLQTEGVRGQVTLARPGSVGRKLRTVLNYGGYVTPVLNAAQENAEPFQLVGASYDNAADQLSLDSALCRAADDAANLARLAGAVPALADAQATGSAAWMRHFAPDRRPVCGAWEDGLWLSGGYGSHGLTGALLGGEILAAVMMKAVLPAPASVVDQVNPQRFLSGSD